MTQDEPSGEGVSPQGVSTRGAAKPAPDGRGIDWAAVRHDYLHSGMAQRRIAYKHGMSAEKLRRRRAAEGWERVAPCVPLPTRRATPREGEPPTPTEVRRARLTKRLYAVLDKKMAELERRMAERKASPQSAADIERDARALTALMQVYAKLVAMDDAAQAANKTANENAGNSGARTDDDADRLRRDLAGRLERLGPGDG
jgi:hypothetical protein